MSIASEQTRRRGLSDVIALSVMSYKLDTIAQEMGVTMRKSSHSPIFAEANDFSCCVTNWEGEQIAQLAGIPIIGAAGGFGPQEVMKDFSKDEIEEGDVFLMNDAYRLGNHLPEMTVVVPVFIRGELLFFTVARAHHPDVGGVVVSLALRRRAWTRAINSAGATGLVT